MLQAVRTWGVWQMAPSRAAEGSTPSSIFIDVCTISCLKVLQMKRLYARLLTCDAMLDRGKKPVIAMPNRCEPPEEERHKICSVLGTKVT